ncbi:MAG: NUDIX hydrolase [Halieaceae bacterium]|jgi:ADP-ribose pyrophosphatase YjhB (NUDIX family)|nr:NUDIX hydrolase [Halieaceae bacterium]PDH39480.1 MAG: NUDIX hydrolase [Halieaceae bacterium MED-G26]RPG92263.1 MAG: NUDIX hydrolase [Cellvibrionales bacterium TMED157]|tara:strand:- start:588 stop:1136 length:549 start_codon:yes stop_codon:yes gene_type:complete
MKYCSLCAHEVVRKIPEGEDRERDVCPSCHEIFYVNPKVIVGCIPTVGDKVLLCKRAIEPRYGKWTLPAGFMENRETTAEGAAREMWEEAEARAVDMALYRIFDVPHISQVYVFYRCQVLDDQFGAGSESLESKLYSEADIPWDELAFPVVIEMLREFFEDRKTQNFPVRNSTIRYQKRRTG